MLLTGLHKSFAPEHRQIFLVETPTILGKHYLICLVCQTVPSSISKMAESTLNSASEERAVVFSKCIHIDLEGDVYLALPEKKFLVSSKIVGNASPVLKAMLGPNFAEGKQVSNTDPEDVPLYEDDPEVMGVIFDVIHHRPHSKSLEMTPAFFEKLASACDKYDCATALSSWSSVHLNILMNPPGYIPWVAFRESDKDDDGQILFSTCMLDDYRGFLQITKRIVYDPIHYHGVINALGPRPYGLSEQAQGRLPKWPYQWALSLSFDQAKLILRQCPSRPKSSASRQISLKAWKRLSKDS